MNEHHELREMFVETASRMMKDLCTKELLEATERGEWAQDLWDTLVEAGMTLVPVPEEAGGVGGSFGDALAILRVAGRFAAPVPLAETLLANWLLAMVRLSVVTDAATVAPVIPEEKVRMQKTEGGWFLSGTARHVPWARQAKSIVLIGDSEQGEMVAVVDPKACSIRPGQDLANEARDEVCFDGVLVGENQVAQAAAGVSKLEVLYRGALMRAAQMAGALERVLELSVNYSKERIQFGRPIARFQAIQQQLAILAGEVTAAGMAVESAMAAVERADMQYDANEAARLATMMAKIRVGEAVGIATAIAHQVHGAIGFTDEHVLHYSTRRLWSWRDEFGTESEWAERLGQHVLERGAEQLWPLVTSL
jgi:alkylation response protein AidB-like acyl-CoA dehydrogenase